MQVTLNRGFLFDLPDDIITEIFSVWLMEFIYYQLFYIAHCGILKRNQLIFVSAEMNEIFFNNLAVGGLTNWFQVNYLSLTSLTISVDSFESLNVSGMKKLEVFSKTLSTLRILKWVENLIFPSEEDSNQMKIVSFINHCKSLTVLEVYAEAYCCLPNLIFAHITKETVRQLKEIELHYNDPEAVEKTVGYLKDSFKMLQKLTMCLTVNSTTVSDFYMTRITEEQILMIVSNCEHLVSIYLNTGTIFSDALLLRINSHCLNIRSVVVVSYHIGKFSKDCIVWFLLGHLHLDRLSIFSVLDHDDSDHGKESWGSYHFQYVKGKKKLIYRLGS